MSLPKTRRIARAALLLAAGAAPVVGAAGSASAAGVESLPAVGSVSALDSTTGLVGGVTDPAGGLPTDQLLGGLPPAAQTLPVADTLPALGG
ncbi:ATP-binding protein [Streptomyces sp. NPDC012888]|uniref:ATP-binding protein n=1 Tax=Streptomyces sp. NPDC012888 TaxID=3364855 RepID=UPI0036BE76E1